MYYNIFICTWKYMAHLKINIYIKTMQFYRMSRYQQKKKIKLSMATSNYRVDTRYALVDTDIINDKKNIIYTAAITFCHWYQSYHAKLWHYFSTLYLYNYTNYSYCTSIIHYMMWNMTVKLPRIRPYFSHSVLCY